MAQDTVNISEPVAAGKEMARVALAGLNESAADMTMLARLQTAAHHDVAQRRVRLRHLVAESSRLSAAVRLQVEFALEELRSTRRPFAASAAAWEAFRARATAELPQTHRLLAKVGHYCDRYARKGDLRSPDEAVRLYEDQVTYRENNYGEDDRLTHIARANLAVALRERNRPGDIDRALAIMREQVAVREADGDEPFLWSAWAVLARTLARSAEAEAVDGRPLSGTARGHAEEAAQVATELIEARTAWYEPSATLTLQAVLVRAYARQLLGELSDAERDVRTVLDGPGLNRVPDLHGWALHLLARVLSMREDRKAEAVAAAEETLSVWKRLFPPQAPEMVGARALADRLRAG